MFIRTFLFIASAYVAISKTETTTQHVSNSYIIIAIFVLIAGIILWNVLGRSNLPSDGDRIDAVKSELADVKAKQQTVIDRLDVIENGLADSANAVGTVADEIGESTSTVITVEERISNSQERVTDSQQLIDENIAILNSIKERGTEIKN